jgi:ketosteroid isomerase-like protein
MTSSALELTRRSFEAAGRRDFDTLMIFFGPESVWDVSLWGLGRHTGLADISAFFGDWLGAFDKYEIALEEAVDLGEGVVLTVDTQRAVPAGGRGFLEIRHATVFVWEAGKVVRATHYLDRDEAREAVGLPV